MAIVKVRVIAAIFSIPVIPTPPTTPSMCWYTWSSNMILDGLHLDYIRYPTEHFGYNPTSVAHFQADTGRSDVPAFNDTQWTQWRRDQVTKLVKRIYLNMLAEKPKMQLSVAAIAWGDGPSGGDFHTSAAYRRTFQDWDSWLSNHYIDWALPMNYEAEARSDQHVWYRDWVDWIQQHHGDGRVGIGLGAWLNTADGNMAQLSYAKAAGGILGTALYSYCRSRPTPTAMPSLTSSITRCGMMVRPPPVQPRRLTHRAATFWDRYLLTGAHARIPRFTSAAAGAARYFYDERWLGRVWSRRFAARHLDGAGDGMADQSVGVAAGTLPMLFCHPPPDPGLTPALPIRPLAALWSRTDKPVAHGDAQRSWLWGPSAYATGSEPYAEAPGGQRTVQYWDKSRMEVTQPGADPNASGL